MCKAIIREWNVSQEKVDSAILRTVEIYRDYLFEHVEDGWQALKKSNAPADISKFPIFKQIFEEAKKQEVIKVE